LILQNKGKLSKGKRASFAEITDQEVDRIEAAVWEVWQEGQQEQLSESSLSETSSGMVAG
jgi:alpha-D-ribose 1-methylphosphonate 5-triphosphate diphosphatase PhnM